MTLKLNWKCCEKEPPEARELTAPKEVVLKYKAHPAVWRVVDVEGVKFHTNEYPLLYEWIPADTSKWEVKHELD